MMLIAFPHEQANRVGGRRGLLLVLSGPSGTGKRTLACRLLDRHGGPGQHLRRSISVTTRPPRLGEVNGKDYFFVTEDCFAGLERKGELLETAEIYRHRYGTPRAFVEDCLARGVDVLLVLDARGRQQIAATYRADLVSVFLLPPDLQVLEQRLRARSQDGKDAITRRLAAAQAEIARSHEYDHVAVNRDVDCTLDALHAIFRAERQRRERLMRSSVSCYPA